MRSTPRSRNTPSRIPEFLAQGNEILGLRSARALARLLVLAVALALSTSSAAADDSADAGNDSAAQPAAAPAGDLDQPTTSYVPTGSPEWVERLTQARRRVTAASAASAVANEAYAQALYHDMPEGAQFDAIKAHREQTQHAFLAAKNALPDLVAGARAAGVSPEVLRVYEESMPD